MNNYTVYMHISPSGKRYIGITSTKVERRWRNGYGYKHQQYFYRAIEKYGWDNFQHIIIANGLSEDEAKQLEMKLIKEFDTTNREKGYNITLGGDGTSGYKLSEESKQRISESKKGKYEGENNPMYGYIWGDNHPMKGKNHSEESKKKMSEAKKELYKNKENHPNYCKTLSEETKQKLRDKALERVENGVYDCLKKKIICLTDMKIYNSLKEASDNEDYIGVKPDGISAVCNNYKNLKIHGKLKDGTPLIWMHFEKYEEMTKEEVEQYLSTVKISKKGINNSNSRKFILRYNGIDLTTVLNKKQLCKFLKTDEKNLKRILDNKGVIDKTMFPKNISEVIKYFDKCVIIELDNKSSFFYANNKEVE